MVWRSPGSIKAGALERSLLKSHRGILLPGASSDNHSHDGWVFPVGFPTLGTRNTGGRTPSLLLVLSTELPATSPLATSGARVCDQACKPFVDLSRILVCGTADTFVTRVETTIVNFRPATTARLEEGKEGEGRFWKVKARKQELGSGSGTAESPLNLVNPICSQGVLH
jgi:hypothetical protein